MKVSVAMITYNHERFVAQAIESVLMQEADFDFELVIGEDCSTDGTRRVVAEYGARHPDKIRLLLPERNLGMNRNLAQTLRACRGAYVALLEGDDYWTSPRKLAKQAALLDERPDCAICFHNVEMFFEDDPGRGRSRMCPDDQKAVSTIEDLLQHNFIPACSTMFRRAGLGDLPEWFYELRMGDWPLHVLNARRGNIVYLPEVMAAYRAHGGGVWSVKSGAEQISAYRRFYELIDAHLEYKYTKLIRRALTKWDYHLGLAYEAENDLPRARALLLKVILADPFNNPLPVLHRVKTALRLYAPGLTRRAPAVSRKRPGPPRC
jgi:glycosyltransferase involved in cell wall biosynthesis